MVTGGRDIMTKEISQLSKKELKEFQQAVAVIRKVFDLSEEDIDHFFSIIKDSKAVSEAIKMFDERITALERAYTKNVDADNRETAKKAYEVFSRKPEVLNL